MRRSVASEQPMCVAIEVGTRSPGQAGCWRSALTRSWWPIRLPAAANATLLTLVLYVVEREVIGREERYLERTFGEEYLAYKARVRRWV